MVRKQWKRVPLEKVLTKRNIYGAVCCCSIVANIEKSYYFSKVKCILIQILKELVYKRELRKEVGGRRSTYLENW